MKTKKFKKLVLNKETIANLNEEAMNSIKGGTSSLDCSITGVTKTKAWLETTTCGVPCDEQ